MTLSLVVLVITLYVAFVLLISAFVSRRATASTFFVGDRNQSVWVVTLAMISAAMSGVTYVSVPGMVLQQGFTYLQMALGFVVGQAVIAFVLVPLYYHLGVTSVYEYLESRFDLATRRCGAMLFFVGKLLSTAVRVMLVCAVMQTLMMDALGVPFGLNVALTMAVAWLLTMRGGVKSVVWTDVFKTLVLVGSIVGVAIVAARGVGASLWQIVADGVGQKPIIDTDVTSPTFVVKHFVAGVLVVVAMTGLDQDMMQRTLSCRTRTEAQRNVMISGVLQLVVIAMMLALGVVLERYAVEILPSGEIRGDELFLSVACAPTMPAVAGVLFVLGVVASSLSSAGSAVTALTTSLVYDLGGGDVRRRRVVLPLVAGLIVALAVVLRAVADGSAIDLVFRLAAYTYGPILGLFAFGVLTRRRPSPVATCLMAVVAPLLTLLVDHFTPVLCGGYRFGHDILAVNGLIMFVGIDRKSVL